MPFHTFADEVGSIKRQYLDDNFAWLEDATGPNTFEDFGAVGNGIVDDTAALQAAINYAIPRGIKISGKAGVIYAVSAISLTGYLGQTNPNIDFNGATVRSNGLSSAPLVTVLNCRGVQFGDVTLDGNWGLSQTTLLKIWANTGASGCSYGRFDDIHFRNAQFAVQIGDPTRIDEPSVSENTFIGCDCIGVLQPVVSYGVQAENSSEGCIWTPNTSGWITYPASWQACAVHVYGGSFRVNGGECVAYASQGAPGPNAIFIVEPVVSIPSGNLYGEIHATGAWFETDSPGGLALNPTLIAPVAGGVISFLHCEGAELGDGDAYIDAVPDYPGDMRVIDCGFFAASTRTHPNINGTAFSRIIADSISFSPWVGLVSGTPGYLQGPTAFTYGAGGTFIYNGQFFVNAAPAVGLGVNGDFCYRYVGMGALTTIYQKRAGAWVGIV